MEIRTKSVIFVTPVSFELDEWPWRTIEYLLYTTRSFVHHSIATFAFWNWSYALETLKSGQIGDFWPVEHWNCTDDLEKYNMTSLLYPSKLCASFICHLWIETGIIIQKYWHQGKVAEFWGHVTLKLDRWSWNTIGRAPLLFHLKLWALFRSRIELKFYFDPCVLPWPFASDLDLLHGNHFCQK